MKRLPGVLALPAALALLSFPARSQNVISAKSGLIHYVEGRVLLDGEPVEPKPGRFSQMRESSVLRTEAGRAEVLISPGTSTALKDAFWRRGPWLAQSSPAGVFLRVGENTELRMLSGRIADTRLELLSGSILIECAEMLKDNSLTVSFRGTAISIREDGLYRIDADPPELRVYNGRAVVEAGGQVLTVKGGRALALDRALAMRKFDSKGGDALYRWGKRRSEYIAMANLSSAKYLHDAGIGWRSGGWCWNPYFGMFTFVPRRGVWYSPFGYRYFSPREVYVVYEPPRRAVMNAWDSTPRYNPNLGYATIAPTPSGHSGTVASSAPPTTASGSQSAPLPRDSGSAGGRSR